MTDISSNDASPAPLLERHYDDGEVSFDATFERDGDLRITVRGRGTIAGGVATLAFFDEVARLLEPSAGTTRILYEITHVRGAPLRTQLQFGKWFLTHRRIVRRAAIVGAGPLERRVATATATLAGIRQVRFFEGLDEARAWLYAEAPA